MLNDNTSDKDNELDNTGTINLASAVDTDNSGDTDSADNTEETEAIESVDVIESIVLEEPHDWCTFCLGENGQKEEPVNKCIQCKEFFCQKHQSHSNLFYCSICLHDIKVEDHQIVKVKEKFSVNLDRMVKKQYHCRQIKFDGETWRRSIALIQTLTDNELHDAVEIHRASVNMMEQEILRRNIKQAQDSVLRDRNTRSSVPKIRVPVVKTTNKTTKSLGTLDPASLAKLLQKSGITPAILQKQLIELLAKKGTNTSEQQ
jgi:predicted HTH domain antitoxin